MNKSIFIILWERFHFPKDKFDAGLNNKLEYLRYCFRLKVILNDRVKDRLWFKVDMSSRMK